ncbi:MAG: hypothetical protein LBC35_04810 [Coriobacteriales bacterium]|jgi:phage shock protein A|nr:hypothetical protein [Coriobacteriales bacterium]
MFSNQKAARCSSDSLFFEIQNKELGGYVSAKALLAVDRGKTSNVLVISLLIFAMVVCSALVLPGCTHSVAAGESEEVADDIHAKAAAEKLLLQEQWELKKTELAQAELELQSAQGMLSALWDKAHPDEKLIATYEKLVEQTNAKIEKLKADIAKLEGYIEELDKQLGEPTDDSNSLPEDDPLLGENAPEDLRTDILASPVAEHDDGDIEEI